MRVCVCVLSGSLGVSHHCTIACFVVCLCGLWRAQGLAVSAVDSVAHSESTHKVAEETLKVVKRIQADLGIADDAVPRYSADENFPNWTKDHKSLTAKHCTREVYRELAFKKTPLGFTIDQAIQPAIDMPHGV